MRGLMILSLWTLLACGSGQSMGGGGGGTAQAGGGSSTGGGSAQGGAGGGSSGGGSATVHASTACPHVDFGTTTSITYHGDTTGLPNWVDSPRLEWQDAPDDSLTFTAPSAGSYAFSLTVDASDAGNFQMGVSVRDFSGAFYSACPSPGTPQTLDGVFEEPTYPATLTAGQQVLMYVSAPYWSVPTSGRYTLTVVKQ
jgi:hypothetical protein